MFVITGSERGSTLQGTKYILASTSLFFNLLMQLRDQLKYTSKNNPGSVLI